MRIDKYLKLSRVIKRRSVAKELLDAGRVTINEKIVKASANVAPTDVVSIRYGNKFIRFEVLRIQEMVRKEEAASMYQLLDETVL
jgi:ribosomal 50S subunit-recycling heat shock protein